MKEIPNFNGRYLIPESGEFIYDVKQQKKILPHLSGIKRRNYYQITLYREGTKITRRVHSWMGITYLGMEYNGNRKLVVDHIDDDPWNNHISNLRVISMRENNFRVKAKNSTQYKLF